MKSMQGIGVHSILSTRAGLNLQTADTIVSSWYLPRSSPNIYVQLRLRLEFSCRLAGSGLCSSYQSNPCHAHLRFITKKIVEEINVPDSSSTRSLKLVDPTTSRRQTNKNPGMLVPTPCGFYVDIALQLDLTSFSTRMLPLFLCRGQACFLTRGYFCSARHLSAKCECGGRQLVDNRWRHDKEKGGKSRTTRRLISSTCTKTRSWPFA